MRSVIYAADFGSGPDKTPEENREALDQAFASLSKEGGTVMASAGTFAGPLRLPDNVTLIGERRPGGPYLTHITC